MSVELKIKSKHLALEAGVIKHEERKLRKQVADLTRLDGEQVWETSKPGAIGLTRLGRVVYKLNSLSDHRRSDVRNENRSTFLARAFISGKPYLTVERSRDENREHIFRSIVLNRTLAMVKKYAPEGAKYSRADLEAWVDAPVA